MIAVNSAMQQDAIIELLNAFNKEGITFVFKEKSGIKLLFETNEGDLEKAAKLAKAEIKAQPWGSVLYFQVTPA
ncbi:hypothetical protein ACWN8V_02460 [Vagococcus elongatus]|uniref:DUF2007 domain-containing protein n=1 Tax=Vagococcus elongatus TaxID=180344 RepID=A0A430B425_9ENTE|nr:hypothetical protein [Vagococcus elongatus]RSU15097.1 hypothetical protein CBF29_01830 [Vagococcus elongatus]